MLPWIYTIRGVMAAVRAVKTFIYATAVSVFTMLPFFSKQLEAKSLAQFQAKNPPIVLHLKNKPLVEPPRAGSGPKLEDAATVVAPRGLQVKYDYSEAPKGNVVLPKTEEEILGLKIKDGETYYSQAYCKITKRNGGDSCSYSYTQPVQFPYYNNGTLTFIQGRTYTDTCDFSAYPPGSDAKFLEMKTFYVPSISSTTTSAIAETIRQFAVSYGDPYISGVFLAVPPDGVVAYKWAFITCKYLRQDGQLATNTPVSKKIVAIGIPDDYIYPTSFTYLDYLVIGGGLTTRIWDYIDQNNFKYEGRGVVFGACTVGPLGEPFPSHLPIIVQSIITDVNDGSPNAPYQFSLSQNYPNPFNSTTVIQFGLNKPAKVTLKVYDLLGKEIATLVNSELNPGTYQATWNAGSAPSGVYVYEIRVDAYTSKKKMLVVK
jgi:hypothetical protein